MGNKSSIAIELETTEGIPAGGELKGRVVVKLFPGFFGCNEAVSVTLVGKETTVSNRTTDESELISLRLPPLTSQSSQRKKHCGYYYHPFSIHLPQNLPSSLKSRDATVIYTLHTSCGTMLKATREVTIVSIPSPRSEAMYLMEPKSLPVTGICGPKGSFKFGARVESSYVRKGQELHLFVAGLNDSTATVRRVQVKLVEQTTTRTGREERKSCSVLTTLSDISSGRPGFIPQRKTWSEVQQSKRQQSDNRMAQACVKKELTKSLASKDNQICIPIPLTAKESCNGRLIEISHHLKIRIKTAGMASNPFCIIPINIGPPPPANQTMNPPLQSTQNAPHSSFVGQENQYNPNQQQSSPLNSNNNAQQQDDDYSLRESERPPAEQPGYVPHFSSAASHKNDSAMPSASVPQGGQSSHQRPPPASSCMDTGAATTIPIYHCQDDTTRTHIPMDIPMAHAILIPDNFD